MCWRPYFEADLFDTEYIQASEMRNDHFASCSTAQHDDFSLHLDVCSVGDADAALADEPSNADGCGF